MPIGGIGTGTVSLGGRGDLRDWEILNRPAKGFTPPHTFFALRAGPVDGAPVTRVLEGPIPPPYAGWFGATVPAHGLPRFRSCRFDAAYPLAQVTLTDPDMPLDVRLEAFNPLIPGDADRSGVPVAVLRYRLHNPRATPVDATVCGNLQNFIGTDGTGGTPCRNRNVYREAADGAVRGVFLTSDGIDPAAEQAGTMALVTDTREVTSRTGWAVGHGNEPLMDLWRDLDEDGRLDERTPDDALDAPHASVAASLTLAPGETAAVTFLLAWHFPNRQSWTPVEGADNRVGNHYALGYVDAWDVAERSAQELEELERDTVAFVTAFCGADLPNVVKEAALSNLSTLRTQTCFRAADGRLYGYEGCADNLGFCLGNCTHVWNYEHATSALFGELARSMREAEFLDATGQNGHTSFRLSLPPTSAKDWDLAAADGQMGMLLKLYREWQACGDDAWLERLWPAARRALSFAWIPGGWDADRDGVMEGAQHVTYDVQLFGPNPLTGIWYLGALRAAEEMALRLDDDAFAAACRDRFERGREWLDHNLFNGSYYEQQVRPITDPDAIAPGLHGGRMVEQDPTEPAYQLGAGCLSDQLVGQLFARLYGLGQLIDPNHERRTLDSILEANARDHLHSHLNGGRSFALGEDAGLLVASYPRGRRPAQSLLYGDEVWSGVEYTVGAHLLALGDRERGARVFERVRARHDGERRNPFDEVEAGHHYVRAMASWAGVPAATGFMYSAVTGAFKLAPTAETSRAFWSNGYAHGSVVQEPTEEGSVVIIAVTGGDVWVREVHLTGLGSVILDSGRTVRRGEEMQLTIEVCKESEATVG